MENSIGDALDGSAGVAAHASRSAPDPGPVSRRAFLKITAAGALALYVPTTTGFRRAHAAPIPGGTLPPRDIPKFQDALVIPPAMPPNGDGTYEIAVRQFSQQILPQGMPPTTVWSYGSVAHPATLNYPAFTIEATRGTPTTVTWVNDLVDGSGRYLPHLLPVDPTLHWANPPGGIVHRDTRPELESTPEPYRGPVPVVVHVHGMEGVDDWADGYAEAWFLPDAVDIPEGYAEVGTWWDFFASKAAAAGVPWAPGRVTSRYPNSQVPATLWYHDHGLGITRLNVYAGPAGFFLLRSEDPADHPTDAVTGAPAVLPGPAPQVGEEPGIRHREIPLAIQDRSFHEDGSLFYPDSRSFFDGYGGPYLPESDVSPIWNPEFFGNCMVVNGRTWPYLDVEPRRYRFRLLNGCNSRFLTLRMDNPQVEVWQIGTEAGYLPAPVRVRDILLAPAERVDVIVDFSRMRFGSTATWLNRAPDSPFGGGGFRPADPSTTGQVMQFRLTVPVPPGTDDPSTPPERLVMPALPDVPSPVTRTRRLALIEEMAESPAPAIPVAALLGTYDPDMGPGGVRALEWHEPVTENPEAGDVEVWEIHNFTADAHPIHIHEVLFQVLDRQGLGRDGRPVRAPEPPTPAERGYKDTVISYPGQVTRLRMQFGQEGQFVWHCHIVEHEDNEMMRPYRIGPVQPGQPVDDDEQD